MTFRLAQLIIVALVASPLAAQTASQGHKFLEAVRKSDNTEVVKFLDQPGQTIVDTRDVTNGEGALHIAVKRGDDVYTRYLLGKGASANLRDGQGATPLLLAVHYSQSGIAEILLGVGANPNLANSSGETPLIRAVQKRDLGMARILVSNQANPDQTDNIAGMSARDYAIKDGRSAAIVKLFDETPKAAKRAVAGPRL